MIFLGKAEILGKSADAFAQFKASVFGVGKSGGVFFRLLWDSSIACCACSAASLTLWTRWIYWSSPFTMSWIAKDAKNMTPAFNAVFSRVVLTVAKE